MAPHLQINERDLSVYVRTQHDQGLDPADGGYSEPQFSGSPAFQDGEGFVGDAVRNREWTIPLVLDADSRSDLFQLVRDIEGEIQPGASVEWAVDGAEDEITYFDLERGRLDVDYQHFLARQNVLRATLKLWTRPYGHTGTYRVLATAVAGTGARAVSATNVLGDRDAPVRLTVTTPTSAVGRQNRMIFGVKYPVPAGYEHTRVPSIVDQGPSTAVASVFGASGRLASQYLGVAVPVATQQIIWDLPLPPTDAGRYRILQPIQSKLASTASALLVYSMQNLGRVATISALKATDPDTSAATSWRMRDIGEITVPTNTASAALRCTYEGASAVVAGATYPIRFDNVIMVPLDHGAGYVPSVVGVGITDDLVLDGVLGEVTVESGGDPLYPLDLRGPHPQLPPIGSAGASGSAEILVVPFQQLDNSDQQFCYSEVGVEVRERFRFLR